MELYRKFLHEDGNELPTPRDGNGKFKHWCMYMIASVVVKLNILLRIRKGK